MSNFPYNECSTLAEYIEKKCLAGGYPACVHNVILEIKAINLLKTIKAVNLLFLERRERQLITVLKSCGKKKINTIYRSNGSEL